MSTLRPDETPCLETASIPTAAPGSRGTPARAATASACRTALAVLPFALGLGACGDPTDSAVNGDGPDADGIGGDAGDSDETGPEDAPSAISRAVVSALESPELEHWEGRLWSVSSDRSLPEGWIVETPPAETYGGQASDLEVALPCDEEDDDCDPDFELLECSSDDDCRHGGRCETLASTRADPEDDARSLCAGHSHHAYERIYGVIVEAEELVDVTSLFVPDGPFLAALRNAITYLARDGRSADVRLQFGSIILEDFDIGEVLDDLTRDLPESSDLSVALGTYREGYDSWNHAKIAAADGEEALVGGMNMSANSYLRSAPVLDLSMEVEGSAAKDAHRFADSLWSFTCGAEFVGDTGRVEYALAPQDAGCPEAYGEALEGRGPEGDVWAASLGRLGDIGPDVADRAMIESFYAARDSIKLSIQDLGPLQIGPVDIYPWPTRVLDALAYAISRGVSVDIIMTTPDEGGGSGDGYSNGWTKRDAIERIEERLRLRDDWLPEGSFAEDALCENLRITSIRPYAESAYPDGEDYFNHAKSFIVDDRAFYIGSQNLYTAELAEFGYLIDEAAAAGELLDTYWDPLWSSSSSEIDDACF